MITTAPQYDIDTIKAAATDRWVEILSALGGIGAEVLDGQHHPCPKCGGLDRFRFFDDGSGGTICNQCHNQKNGDGIATIMWLCDCDFRTAIAQIANHLGLTAINNGKAPALDIVELVARKKKMPVESFKAYGAEPAMRGKLKVARLPVYNSKGVAHSHFDLTTENGKGWFKKDDEKSDGKKSEGTSGLFLPGRLPQPGETWLIVEGVKDASALHGLDFLACGLPTNKMAVKYVRLFAGVNCIIVPDRDTGGEAGSQTTAAILYGVAASDKIAKLPAEFRESKGADVRDVLAQRDGEQLLRQAIQDAEPWQPPDAGEGSGGQIANAVVVGSGEDRRTIPLPMHDVLDTIQQTTGSWPRRVGVDLFVHDDHGVSWLPSSAALFGYLAAKTGSVRWTRGTGCVSKDETHCELKRTAKDYQAVESLPHEPTIDGHYYACKMPEPGNGDTLRKLLNRFEPASDIDRDLIQAAFMTPIWGGHGGTRPVFVITSDDGRGTGKSKLAEMVGHVVGGTLHFSHNEEIAKIKTRMLSPDALTMRVCLLDNVKSLKFSWAELEAIITAPVIGGHRMYSGEARRPNTVSWFLTLNGASLSTDMAQRSVIIKVVRPKRSGSWEEDTIRFILDHRDALLADLVGCLRAEAAELHRFTRWATWEKGVLARLPEPSEAQQVILERMGTADVEEEEAGILEDFFSSQLRTLGYNVDRDVIHIPNQVAARWFNWAHNDKHRVASVSRTLKQMWTEKRLRRIQPDPERTYGRGFLWTGKDSETNAGKFIDIQERLVKQRRETN